jgi:hypothetical protein
MIRCLISLLLADPSRFQEVGDIFKDWKSSTTTCSKQRLKKISSAAVISRPTPACSH